MADIASAYVKLIPRFDNLTKSIESQVSASGKSAGKAAGRAIGAGISSGASSGSAKAASAVTSKFSSAGSKVSSTFSSLGSRMFSALPSGAQSAASAIGSKFSGLASRISAPFSGAGQRMFGGISAAAVACGNVIANFAMRAVDSLSQLATGGISASDSMKKFEQTMAFAGKSADEIGQVSAAAKAYADQTVYDTQDVMNTTAQLAANSVPNYQQLVEAAGNLNAVAGGNADTFKSVSMVLTQTAGQGKLTTENWNQLADAIPGASGRIQQALSDAGAYTGNFREAMEDGEISAQEFNDAIMSLGFEDAAVKAASSTSTFEGAVGNMQASAENAFMAVYDAINGDGRITGAISAIGAGLESFGASAADVVGRVIAKFEELSPLMEPIGEAAQRLFAAVQDGVAKVMHALEPIIASVLPVIAPAIDVVTSAIDVVTSAVNLLASAFTALLEFLQPVISDLSDVLANTVLPALSGAFDWLSGVIKNAGSNFQAAADTASSAWSGVQSFFSSLPGNIVGFFGGIGDKIGGFFESAGSKVREIFDGVVNFVRGIPDQIIGFFSGIGERITSAFGSIRFPSPHISWDNVDVMGAQIPIPNIQFYASGGIVTAPTLGMIGEAGYDEAVVPLNSRAVRPFAEAVADVMGGGPSFGEMVSAFAQALESADITANAYIDKRLVSRELSGSLAACMARNERARGGI